MLTRQSKSNRTPTTAAGATAKRDARKQGRHGSGNNSGRVTPSYHYRPATGGLLRTRTGRLHRQIDDPASADWNFRPVGDTAPRRRNTGNRRLAALPLCSGSTQQRVQICQATQLTVRLAAVYHGIQLTIDDNGIGFDIQSLHGAHHGFGVRLMIIAVHEAGGTITIDSGPGNGTRVTITLPLD